MQVFASTAAYVKKVVKCVKPFVVTQDYINCYQHNTPVSPIVALWVIQATAFGNEEE